MLGVGEGMAHDATSPLGDMFISITISVVNIPSEKATIRTEHLADSGREKNNDHIH